MNTMLNLKGLFSYQIKLSKCIYLTTLAITVSKRKISKTGTLVVRLSSVLEKCYWFLQLRQSWQKGKDGQAKKEFFYSALCDCVHGMGQHQLGIKGKGLLKESYFCLLYTSPSPRDRQKSRMPSSA